MKLIRIFVLLGLLALITYQCYANIDSGGFGWFSGIILPVGIYLLMGAATLLQQKPAPAAPISSGPRFVHFKAIVHRYKKDPFEKQFGSWDDALTYLGRMKTMNGVTFLEIQGMLPGSHNYTSALWSQDVGPEDFADKE